MNIIEAVELAARDLAPGLGLEIYSVAIHPSDDLMIFTSEGKKYVMKSAVVAALNGDEEDVEALALVVYAALGGAVKVELPTEEEFNAPRTEPGIHQAVEEAILVNAEAFEAECRAAFVRAEEKVAEEQADVFVPPAAFVAPAEDVPFAPITDDTSHDSPKAKRGKKAPK